jgi:hypothetical protein
MSFVIPATAAFPVIQAGRLPHHPFRGLLSVHSRYGLHARQVAYATLFTRSFDSFVTSTAVPIATGWNDQLPGGNHTHWRSTPFHGALNCWATIKRPYGTNYCRPLVYNSKA